LVEVVEYVSGGGVQHATWLRRKRVVPSINAQPLHLIFMFFLYSLYLHFTLTAIIASIIEQQTVRQAASSNRRDYRREFGGHFLPVLRQDSQQLLARRFSVGGCEEGVGCACRARTPGSTNTMHLRRAFEGVSSGSFAEYEMRPQARPRVCALGSRACLLLTDASAEERAHSDLANMLACAAAALTRTYIIFAAPRHAVAAPTSPSF